MDQQDVFAVTVNQQGRSSIVAVKNGGARMSRIGRIKRAVAAALVAVILAGGSLTGVAAKADPPAEAGSVGGSYTETTSSPDGKVVFICTYDDVTGKLLFCDVLYFPDKAGKKKR
jgi:hypothetical protein